MLYKQNIPLLFIQMVLLLTSNLSICLASINLNLARHVRNRVLASSRSSIVLLCSLSVTASLLIFWRYFIRKKYLLIYYFLSSKSNIMLYKMCASYLHCFFICGMLHTLTIITMMCQFTHCFILEKKCSTNSNLYIVLHLLSSQSI